MDRRTVLMAGAALSLAPLGAKAAPGDADAALDVVLKAQFEADLDESHEQATSLGLDVGARAAQRWKLSDRSAAAVAKRRAEAPGKLAAVKAVDHAALTAASTVAYDVAVFRGELAVERGGFEYGGGGPYVLTQQQGAYQQTPDWLDNQHPVKSKDDADAYLSRLVAFGMALDQETERMRADAAGGVIAPDFILAKTIAQLRTLRDTAGADSILAKSLDRRAKAAGVDADYRGTASSIVDAIVRPATDRQLAALEATAGRAKPDAGVWKLPRGGEFYAHTLKAFTTTTMSAEEIHKIGLQQVRELHGKIDALLKSQGYRRGSVGDRLKIINAEERFLWPNTDEGRAGLLASLNKQMEELAPLLPRVFKTLPKAKVEIRRVPPSIEIGAPGGYYQRASLDGSRPGAYYINLRDTADWPKWGLPSLTYHEASPGHHFQNTVLQEAGELPIYRKLGGFSAYGEGWALYAERLADELGVYENDPFGKIGFYQSYLFRATRLVVDTGLHHKRWSREQAIAWMMDNAAEPKGSAEREIDRYCVNPGQACSYKIGQTVIARLRADAEKKLGRKFDIGGFHDAVLLSGSVPMSVLERIVADWVATQA